MTLLGQGTSTEKPIKWPEAPCCVTTRAQMEIADVGRNSEAELCERSCWRKGRLRVRLNL